MPDDAPPPPPPPTPGNGTVVSEPYYKGLFGDDGSINAKNIERFPEHLSGAKALVSRAKNIDGVFQMWDQANALASKKALAPLPENAPEEMVKERKSHLDTLMGVPPTPKDYGVARPADFPEQHWDQPLADTFATWAHKNSVSPAAVKELFAVQLSTINGQLAKQKQYEDSFYAKEQQTFDSAIRRENITPERAAELVEKGAIGLGMDLNDNQTKLMMKGSLGRLMALRHALGTGSDRAAPGAGRETNADPGALADAAIHDKANPLYAPYWNRDGKHTRQAHDSAVSQVNEWRRLDAAKKGAGNDRRRR